MKILIIYYSYEGNADMIANLIKNRTNGDLLRLKPKKDVKQTRISKYLWGGKQVVMNEKPELEAINRSPNDYDLIFIGTPVWAFSFAPAINTFISENKIENKKIALFCTSGGGKGRTFQKLKEKIPNNNFIGEIEFIEPLKKDKKEIENKVSEWLDEIIKLCYNSQPI